MGVLVSKSGSTRDVKGDSRGEQADGEQADEQDNLTSMRIVRSPWRSSRLDRLSIARVFIAHVRSYVK